MKIEKVKDAGIMARQITGGLVAGKFAMDMLSSKPTLAPALGLLGVAPFVFDVGGNTGKVVGGALLAAGLIQAGKNFTNGKTGILAKVNSALPALSGFNGYSGFAGMPTELALLSGVGESEPVMAYESPRSLLM